MGSDWRLAGDSSDLIVVERSDQPLAGFANGGGSSGIGCGNRSFGLKERLNYDYR